MKQIFYGQQKIFKEDMNGFDKILLKEKITTGESVKKFESKIQKILLNKYIKACNSGTGALHLAFLSAGLKKNSIIIMPSVNFISAYSVAEDFNLKIYLSDVDPITGQMRPVDVLDVIKKNKLKKIDAILVMYMGGYPENVDKFFKLKKKLNCILIEDACHAFGAKYVIQNKVFSIGSCKHSDYCAFSFHPLKTITTGEGGAIATKSKKNYDKINKLLSHGIIRKPNEHWEYDIKNLSYNFRLSDLNCELGYRQLKKLRFIINYRKNLYHHYLKKLKQKSKFITVPEYSSKIFPSYHLFLININFKKIGRTKKKFFNLLKEKNIFLQFHYIPIYKFSAIKGKNKINSEKYYNNTVSLPIHLGLKKKDLDKVIREINRFIDSKKSF